MPNFNKVPNKPPTAKQFIKRKGFANLSTLDITAHLMVEFAKAQVFEALKIASDKARLQINHHEEIVSSDMFGSIGSTIVGAEYPKQHSYKSGNDNINISVNEDSILGAFDINKEIK